MILIFHISGDSSEDVTEEVNNFLFFHFLIS